MSDIALCPNCGGQKTTSKPPYIAGDVNSWVASDIPMYPCPTCDGHGWILVDSVPQEDFTAMKSAALLSMGTAENLMDECIKRADRIKELEDMRHRLEVVNTDLMHKVERDKIDLELLDMMLKVVNPLIGNGEFSCPPADSGFLDCRMYGLCQTVNMFRRKHNIVGRSDKVVG